MMNVRLSAALLAGASILASGNIPAAAIEPAAAVEALGKALSNGSSITTSYASATASGADIVVTALKVTHASGDSEDSVTFDTAIIEAPTESGAGVFDSPSITFTGGDLQGEATGTIGSARMTDVTVFDPANVRGSAILFATANASDLHFTRGGQPVDVTVAFVDVTSGNVIDNVPQDNSVEVRDLVVTPGAPRAGMPGPQAIGYDTLVFDISWDSTRDLAAATMTVNDFTLTLQDGGTLSISGTAGKLPDPRVLNDPNAKDAASKVEIHDARIRFDDNSLAGRVLDYAAGKQGIGRAEYAQQLSAALPFMLSFMNNAAFQEQVAAAASAFLTDPQSLTIDIAPDTAVTGDEILGLLRTSPGTIPDRLKASVSANTADTNAESAAPGGDAGVQQ